MLKQLDVSKSGYYDYINRKPSYTKQRREKITKKVEEIYRNSHEIYGSPKITEMLNQNGEKVSLLNHKFCDNVNCRLIYTVLSCPFIFNRKLFATC